MPRPAPDNKAPSAQLAADPSTAEFKRVLEATVPAEHYQLRLYVTGSSLRSLQAVATMRSLCEEYLPGRHDLEIVDLFQQPAQAAGDQIVAAPTLIKTRPKPPKRLVGDLSNRERVLIGLNIHPVSQANGGMTTWVKV